MFAGAQNALFAVAQVLLEPGDEVILIEPFYTTYPASVTASGATLVSVAVKSDNKFQLDVADIAAKITPKTRAIVLNSPNNPTGAVYTREQLEGVVALCLEHDIWLVSDAVYMEIIPEEDRQSVASIPEAAPICVTLSSLSKSHRMTGWRLGWVVGPPELISHLANLSMCMAYGLPTFIQDAATYALDNDFETAMLVQSTMDSRRAAVWSVRFRGSTVSSCIARKAECLSSSTCGSLALMARPSLPGCSIVTMSRSCPAMASVKAAAGCSASAWWWTRNNWSLPLDGLSITWNLCAGPSITMRPRPDSDLVSGRPCYHFRNLP